MTAAPRTFASLVVIALLLAACGSGATHPAGVGANAMLHSGDPGGGAAVSPSFSAVPGATTAPGTSQSGAWSSSGQSQQQPGSHVTPHSTSGRMLPVDFWINPTPPATSPNLTSDDVEKAILAAVAAWQGADPQVNLVYEGRTSNIPGGFNGVVGFATANGGSGITDGPSPSCTGCTNPYYTSFDVRLESGATWAWNPCDAAQGQACTSVGSAWDVEAVATHEIGHVLGMGHSPHPDADYELTMSGYSYAGYTGTERYLDTLGLGDVVGVRHLYPTSAPIPTIYTP